MIKFKEFGTWIKAALGSKGWTQKRLAKEVWVVPSVVTDYISGKKRPKPWRLGIIAALLDATIDEVDYVAELCDYDPTDLIQSFEWRRNWVWLTEELFIKQAQRLIDAAIVLQDYDDPKKAMELYTSVISSIDRMLEQGLDSHSFKDRMTVLARAYLARMSCYAAYFDRVTVVPMMSADFIKARQIAKELGDDRVDTLAHAWLADSYYIARKAKRSADLGEEIIEGTDDPGALLITLRLLMLNYANLGAHSNYLESESGALDLTAGSKLDKPSDKAALFEAMGRSRVILGLPHADERFDEARREIRLSESSGDYLPIRLLQLHRGRLLALTKASNPDKEYAEELARKAIQIARGYGFERHLGDIKSMTATLKIAVE